jgi:HK97 family phage major capsid protein
MTFDSTALSGGSILAPADVQGVVIEPLTRESVAMTVSTVITTERHETRFPIVVSDPTSSWTKEGDEPTLLTSLQVPRPRLPS